MTAGVVGIMTAASLAAHAGGVNWLNPVDGLWSLGTNWDSGVVPTNPDMVSLGLAGAYRVSLTAARSAGTMSIINSDVELAIENAATLAVFGDFVNEGLVNVNPNAFGSATSVLFSADATLSGNGEFLLSAPDSRARITTNNDATVTHAAGHLIRGMGRIEAQMINNGTIRAESGEIRFTTMEKTNNALIEGSGDGVIEVNGTTITQGPSGLITAQGLGSQVELHGATIIGGDLRGIVNADVSVDSSSVLDGVRFTGEMNLQNAQVLTIRNSFENNGTIDVNPFGFGSTTSVFFEDTMTLEGDGEIELSAPASRARIQTGAGAVLTVNPLMVVRGTGRIEADYVNNGLLSSNEGFSIELTSNPKHNNAVMEAIGGSDLNIQGVTVSQGSSGVIRALGAPSETRLINAEIVGGTLLSDGLGKSVVVNSSVLDGVTHIGELEVSNAQVLTLRGSFINSGILSVNPLGFASTTTLVVGDSMEITGGGSIVLAAPLSRARIQTDDGAVLTIASDQTIRGLGQIEGAFVNNGLISSDVGGEIHLLNDPKINNATMEAINGSTMRLNGVTVTQGAGGEIRADGASSVVELVGATLAGGDLVTTGTSLVETRNSALLVGVNNLAFVQVANAHVLQIEAGTLNNGVIEVNPIAGASTTSLQFNEDMTLEGTGTILLNSLFSRARIVGLTTETDLAMGTGQRLEGIGQIGINLLNLGVIAPGIDGVGEMTATMPVVLAGVSSFEVEVSPSSSDLIDSNSSIVVGGALDISYVDGFAPLGYWARTIMEGTEISGVFNAINVPAPAPGLVTKVVNTGTELIVGQTCPSDQNLDGTLDFFDISSFLTAYGAMDPAADFNEDGQFDFFDISAFLVAYSEGCGS